MQSTVTKRGQTVVPARVPKRHGILKGGRLVWLDDGRTIQVVPVPAVLTRPAPSEPGKAVAGLASGLL